MSCLPYGPVALGRGRTWDPFPQDVRCKTGIVRRGGVTSGRTVNPTRAITEDLGPCEPSPGSVDPGRARSGEPRPPWGPQTGPPVALMTETETHIRDESGTWVEVPVKMNRSPSKSTGPYNYRPETYVPTVSAEPDTSPSPPWTREGPATRTPSIVPFPDVGTPTSVPPAPPREGLGCHPRSHPDRPLSGVDVPDPTPTAPCQEPTPPAPPGPSPSPRTPRPRKTDITE